MDLSRLASGVPTLPFGRPPRRGEAGVAQCRCGGSTKRRPIVCLKGEGRWRGLLWLLLSTTLTFQATAQVMRSGPSAKDLYLESASADQPLPQAEAPQTGSNTLGRGRDLKRSEASTTAVQHLGVRYNILLFGQDGDVPQPADAQRSFRTGDCIGLELEVNRAGYLYVLAEGSSGTWEALVPSALVANEANQVSPRTRVQAPERGCFEFTDPPGTERLFLIFSRAIGDVSELLRLYRLSSIARTDRPSKSAGAGGEALRAQLRDRLGSRDLKLTRIVRPESPDERPFTVYAVGEAPRLFVEIALRHE